MAISEIDGIFDENCESIFTTSAARTASRAALSSMRGIVELFLGATRELPQIKPRCFLPVESKVLGLR